MAKAVWNKYADGNDWLQPYMDCRYTLYTDGEYLDRDLEVFHSWREQHIGRDVNWNDIDSIGFYLSLSDQIRSSWVVYDKRSDEAIPVERLLKRDYSDFLYNRGCEDCKAERFDDTLPDPYLMGWEDTFTDLTNPNISVILPE